MSADLSVVICSLNGASGLDRCLTALAAQTARPQLEIIVVDDGSTDGTSYIARLHRAILVRHETNRGLAAARNSGVRAAGAPIVAFLDDDCEPEPQWAQLLLSGYIAEEVAGVGGPAVPQAPRGFMSGYLARHNPLQPLEIDLANSDRLAYRLYLYLRRQWTVPNGRGRRDVYSLVGANMSFRRAALMSVGLFDGRFRFGAEEVDLCIRLREAAAAKPARLVFEPDARVTHHFTASLADTLRRSRAYGRGSARLYRKRPSMLPTIFPGPLAMLAAIMVSARRAPLLVTSALLPLLLYPRGLRDAITARHPAFLLEGYVNLAQEASEDVGFLQGWWAYRHLSPAPSAALSADGVQAAAVPERLP
jgi:glycosyltransferase involved in cell wall biosynthesis